MNEIYEKLADNADKAGIKVERPFIGDPNDLSLPSREEMIYKYKYLECGIQALASEYRVTPTKLEEFFEELKIEPAILITEEDFDKLNSYVNDMYRNIRIRMSGLVALQTAKIWEGLAETEETLLASLRDASETLLAAPYIEPKDINTLVNAHSKMVDRQALIQKAIEMPAASDIQKIAGVLSEQLKDLMSDIDGDHGLPT